MHAASQLFVEAFEVQVEGERVSPDTVFPDWSPLDRFGIVVTEPLGGLGASLLIQLAIAMFYSVRPDRRAGTPVYPEIYLFHVGGPHGDFSYFDFWPPRKEVRVPARAQENITDSVTPLPGVMSFREELASLTLPCWPDPSVAADGYRWADVVEHRADEVVKPVRARVAEALAARVDSGELAEAYQRITTAEVLAYIAGRS